MDSNQKKLITPMCTQLYEIEDYCEDNFKNNSDEDMQDEEADREQIEDETKMYNDSNGDNKDFVMDDKNSEEDTKDEQSADFPESGISVEINIGNKSTSHTDSYVPLKTGTS